MHRDFADMLHERSLTPLADEWARDHDFRDLLLAMDSQWKHVIVGGSAVDSM